ncbi:MFS transporter [Roseibium sp.]|uniref:MFS transporter n=1 Tax=Roseibium sp. TaxID=1936156 RepID=UPI003A97B490
MKGQTRKPGTLGYWQLFCFGIMTTPIAMSGLALVMYIPTFYATQMGLGFTAVGLVVALGRLFDVVSDPLIGFMTDRTQSRFGPRKPWIVIGTPCFAGAVWLLLVPPETAGMPYLAFACFLFFLCVTVLDIPYSSIGLEISPDVHERSMVAGSKAVFQVSGAIIAATLPVAFGLAIPNALAVIASVVAALCLVSLILFLIFVPERPRAPISRRTGFFEMVRLVLGQREFRSLVMAFVIVQSANALTAALAVLFVTHVIARPDLVAPLVLLLFVSTALLIPVWIMLSRKIGKKQTWQVSILLCAAALLGAFVLGPGSVLGAVAVFALVGAVFGCDAIMPTSMLADIVWEKERETGAQAGLFLAFKNAVSKLTFVIPMALAFPVLDLVAFQREGANGEMQLMTLLAFFAGLPIVLRIAAAVYLQRAMIPQPASHFDAAPEPHADAA